VLLAAAALFGWQAWERAKARPSPEAEALYRQGVANLHAGSYFAAGKALEQAAKLAPNFALAHARLAEAWTGLDLNEKATQEMLLVRRLGLGGLSRVERLQVEAIDFTITREFAKAAEKYEEMARAGADDARLDLGRTYENAGTPDKAMESYRKNAEGPGHNPAAWLSLAVLYSRGSNAAKADDAFQHAEHLYQAGNNLEGLTELAFQRGAAASVRDQFESAARSLQGALEIARLAGNVHEEVRSKLYLSSNAYRAGDIALAERYSHEALETARINQIGPHAVRGLITIGLAYSRKGDVDGAERHYREALALARAGNSPRLIAISLLSLAALHDAAKDYPNAAKEAAEALPFYEANHFLVESFQCLLALGRARLWGNDDPAAADSYFQRAFAAAENANNPNLKAYAEESRGAALSAQEKYPQALPHFQKELEFSTTDERHGYAAVNYAQKLWVLGRYAECG
jgi:tetratricopeptide (TPR) repeat protein